MLLLGDDLDRCVGWTLAAKRRRANDGETRRQPPYSAAELQLTNLALARTYETAGPNFVRC